MKYNYEKFIQFKKETDERVLKTLIQHVDLRWLPEEMREDLINRWLDSGSIARLEDNLLYITNRVLCVNYVYIIYFEEGKLAEVKNGEIVSISAGNSLRDEYFNEGE